MDGTSDGALADELRARIAAGEGRRLELKRGLPSRPKVARTLAAFANGPGGLLLVGVEDDLSLVGARDPVGTARELADIAEHDVRPPLAPWIFEVALEGVPVVACFVARSERIPHESRVDADRCEVTLRLAASTVEVEPEVVAAKRAAERPLDEAELEIRSRIRVATAERAPERSTLDEVVRGTGIAPSRVRRALVRLERGGWIFGLGGAGGARRFAAH